jgi:hypothetical protein
MSATKTTATVEIPVDLARKMVFEAMFVERLLGRRRACVTAYEGVRGTSWADPVRGRGRPPGEGDTRA